MKCSETRVEAFSFSSEEDAGRRVCLENKRIVMDLVIHYYN